MDNPPVIKELGRRLTTGEVAAIFGVSEGMVLKYFARYGGVKLGRRPVFFESLIGESIRKTHAAQAQEEREMDRALVRSGQASEPEDPEPAAADQGRGSGMGGRHAAGAGETREDAIRRIDRHGLAAGVGQ
ncbi:MAG: hypothetical protein ACEB74_13865 [Desulfovibrio aminophilus]|uniref:hypothetical protein n=1 Tax=Desulfovibrio aminophilus TaxID=81425 RepID=UPI0039ECD8AC